MTIRGEECDEVISVVHARYYAVKILFNVGNIVTIE